MKHFYSFALAIIAMFGTQLLFAQQTISADRNSNGLIASTAGFNNPDISLNQRTGFFTEGNTESLKTNEKNNISTKGQYTHADFRIFPVNTGNDFNAIFIAPKSGKAVLEIKSISGQVIYKENIEIIKGNNSRLIKSANLKSGMYLVSIENEQVNYNGKLQKM